jgi:hypothetical protein
MFFDTLRLLESNFLETPMFFQKTLRKHIIEGTASQEQYLSALAAHEMFYGNLSLNQVQKANAFIKEKVSTDRLLEQIKYSSDEQQTLNLIRGARIANKIQSRVKDESKEAKIIFDIDTLTKIVEVVKSKIAKLAESQRNISILYWYAAISDYPNSCVNIDKDEANIGKTIKQAFENVTIRGAYPAFLTI